MFLNQLTEKEKLAFASFFLNIAEADEEYSEEEYDMFQEYCKEMRLYYFDYEHMFTTEEIFDTFKNSSKKNKKIALYGAMEVIGADGEVDIREIEILDKFTKYIGLSDEETALIVKNFNEISETEVKISDIIFKEDE